MGGVRYGRQPAGVGSQSEKKHKTATRDWTTPAEKSIDGRDESQALRRTNPLRRIENH